MNKILVTYIYIVLKVETINLKHKKLVFPGIKADDTTVYDQAFLTFPWRNKGRSNRVHETTIK